MKHPNQEGHAERATRLRVRLPVQGLDRGQGTEEAEEADLLSCRQARRMVGLLVDKYKYSLEEATEIGIRLEEMVWLLDQSQSDSYRSMVDEVVNSLQRKQLSRQKLSRTTAQNKPGETLLDILTGD